MFNIIPYEQHFFEPIAKLFCNFYFGWYCKYSVSYHDLNKMIAGKMRTRIKSVNTVKLADT
jgi:hypothetical protein